MSSSTPPAPPRPFRLPGPDNYTRAEREKIIDRRPMGSQKYLKRSLGQLSGSTKGDSCSLSTTMGAWMEGVRWDPSWWHSVANVSGQSSLLHSALVSITTVSESTSMLRTGGRCCVVEV